MEIFLHIIVLGIISFLSINLGLYYKNKKNNSIYGAIASSAVPLLIYILFTYYFALYISPILFLCTFIYWRSKN